MKGIKNAKTFVTAVFIGSLTLMQPAQVAIADDEKPADNEGYTNSVSSSADEMKPSTAPSAKKAEALRRYMKALRIDQKIQKMMERIRDRQTELINKLMTETFEKENLTPEERKKKIEIATKFLIDRSWEIVQSDSDPASETNTALLTALDREYNTDELNAISEFYESSTGQKVLDSTQALATSVMDATSDKLKPAIQEILAEELKRMGVQPSIRPSEASGKVPDTTEIPQYHR